MNILNQYCSQLEQEQITIAKKIRQAEEISDVCDDVGQHMLHNWRARLNKVQLALTRVNSGEYGICVSCQRPIAVERLAAVPYADKCVACQRLHESQQYAFGHYQSSARV